ncbi:hypothetical protein GCM10023172_23750 [Hymenobacter ginsengisoli]|uniref:Uncharacterized protein n=1 Tax=Hymenobacter ginsengisoli TaxID=1051626 RepID=A0ABP8QGD9_9BACT|nr:MULTISPECIES: hypothetical protein [unclassified Hymenobacter]MBO2033231.1 hypothetical protein [Hymenobacter sp. BT559]
MEYLFGFICTLFKIAIQAGLYVTAALWLTGLAARRPTSLVKLKRMGYAGWQLWRRLFVVTYMALFVFSCTYWGDHGLGDSARIPLGHGEEMSELNGTDTYFEPKAPFVISDMGGAQQIDKFKVVDDILCGQAEETRYFTYNLVTKQSRVFADSLAYNAYAAPRGLPPSGELESFWKQYSRYWGGWRFWLLA